MLMNGKIITYTNYSSSMKTIEKYGTHKNTFQLSTFMMIFFYTDSEIVLEFFSTVHNFVIVIN
jgi:hypothetical protein